MKREYQSHPIFYARTIFLVEYIIFFFYQWNSIGFIHIYSGSVKKSPFFLLWKNHGLAFDNVLFFFRRIYRMKRKTTHTLSSKKIGIIDCKWKVFNLPWKQDDTRDVPERFFLRLLRLASSWRTCTALNDSPVDVTSLATPETFDDKLELNKN